MALPVLNNPNYEITSITGEKLSVQSVLGKRTKKS